MVQVSPTLIKVYQFLIYYSLFITIYLLYISHILRKAKLDKTTAKKWKLISKWEFRTTIQQEHLAIKEFIERYTENHKINWSEHI